jgi:hypothetical protein
MADSSKAMEIDTPSDPHVFLFNIGLKKWEHTIIENLCEIPDTNEGVSGVYYLNNIILFGGRKGEMVSNDLYSVCVNSNGNLILLFHAF